MNKLSFLRAASAALVLGAMASPAAFAQSTTTTNSTTTTAPAAACTGGGHRHHFAKVLTPAERAELKKDKEAVLAANPSLQTSDNNLKQQFATLKADKATDTPAQWQAFHQQKVAYHQQLRSAILLADPSASAIFAKLDAAKHHRST